jgi:membrane protein required for colicin V production
MNTLDYIIIAFLLYLLIRGIFRGLIREIFSIVGVILGIWLGNLFQPWMTGNLKAYIPLPQYLPLLSFILLFVGILIICNLLGWALKLLFKNAFTGWPDMTFGAVLAVLKGIIITYLVIVIFSFYVPEKTAFIRNSTLAPWIIKSYQRVTGFISPDHYNNWKKKLVVESKKIGDTVSDKVKDLVKDNE